MNSKARPACIFLSIMVLLTMFSRNDAAVDIDEKPIVRLNYSNGLIQPFGRVKLSDGEKLFIHIINVPGDPNQYEVEVTGQSEVGIPQMQANVPAPSYSIITITIIHDSKYQSYRVAIKKKPDESTESRVWIIPVFTHGWTLDFSGAFTFDWLKNPVYYLDKVSKDTDPEKYAIRENKKAEDSVVLGAAAMVHLYHTKHFNYSKWNMALAPLSFGLGVGANNEMRYYLGSSIRFGEVFFLAVGAVFGKVERLPANLEVGGETMDVDALAILPKRNSWCAFLGISYAFGRTKAKEQIEQVFSMTQ